LLRQRIPEKRIQFLLDYVIAAEMPDDYTARSSKIERVAFERGEYLQKATAGNFDQILFAESDEEEASEEVVEESDDLCRSFSNRALGVAEVAFCVAEERHIFACGSTTTFSCLQMFDRIEHSAPRGRHEASSHPRCMIEFLTLIEADDDRIDTESAGNV
jgi:hypothetical protein